ncbi:hypothetical protein [Melittangium boletus]|uniref:Uncharacterized protein n=1 Tax=Melittangium boletus DSM 14713 TaxID=1294270 RepID=A0A286SGI0_9BACT|nr:hypothetical protein [Melittangium boletus]ATB26636.1 hypothetical protein MEBOL_000064 [Melittangium boletus DSM 14713]
MKSRAPRGSTLLTAMGITVVLALIIFGVLTYTGSEQERSGRSVRDIDAQTCAESAAHWGRKYYGDNFVRWNEMLGPNSGYSNPAETNRDNWGPGSFGRLDGQEVTIDRPADFRVTIRDNADEAVGAAPNPQEDNDLQIILRAECLVPRLALRTTDLVEAPREVSNDPYAWHGQVLSETSQTRRNKVVEVVLIHVPLDGYKGQRGGGASGDQNVTQ